MKKLWRRATGIIKDRNSLWMTTLRRRRLYYHHHHRNTDLEVAVIKATSHDDTYVDYENARGVFTWVRTSPTHLVMFMWALTQRVNRTRDWVVALKSLILFHGVLCTKAPGVTGIGRLPFDLSSFEDRGGPRRWARSSFVRSYFAFLDAKAVALASKEVEGSDECVLDRVQKFQDMLDVVLQVQPWGMKTNNVLVFEAMDGMLIEVFDLYSKICDGIAKSLMKSYTQKLGKSEASMALQVLNRATRQGHELEDYFEFCGRIGLLDETEVPTIEKIPDGDFLELERIIGGAEVGSSSSSWLSDYSDTAENEEGDDDRREIKEDGKRESGLKTVVTDKWEVFDEELSKDNEMMKIDDHDPFAASVNFPPLIQLDPVIDHGGAPAGSQLLISL